MYTLTLAEVPDRYGREPHLRLKALLKIALRSCGLKCVAIAHNDNVLHAKLAAERATAPTAAPTNQDAQACGPEAARGIVAHEEGDRGGKSSASAPS